MDPGQFAGLQYHLHCFGWLPLLFLSVSKVRLYKLKVLYVLWDNFVQNYESI